METTEVPRISKNELKRSKLYLMVVWINSFNYKLASTPLTHVVGEQYPCGPLSKKQLTH